MATVVEDPKLDRAPGLPCQPLGVTRRDDPIEPAGHDLQGTGDLARPALQAQFERAVAGLFVA
jgi:hypothetical protein